MDLIRTGLYQGELQDAELLVFTDKWIFERVFYKGNLKISMLFETLLHLHEIKMEGRLIMHVLHVLGTRMVEAGIYGLSRVSNTGFIIRGIENLKFIPLQLGSLERSKDL